MMKPEEMVTIEQLGLGGRVVVLLGDEVGPVMLKDCKSMRDAEERQVAVVNFLERYRKAVLREDAESRKVAP